MSDLTIKKRVNANQVKKYKQYGYFSTGQTKDSLVQFETLMTALNKINTDLCSLSISVERVKQNRDASFGTLSELRELLNHANDAKKVLKQSTFKTFLPNELDQIKKIYSTIQSFLESIQTFVDFDLKSQKLIKAELQEDYENARDAYDQSPTAENYGDLKDIEQSLFEISETVDFDEKISTSQIFKIYFNTISELQSLIENKLLRNEGMVTELAKQVGGGRRDWISYHQGTEYI